MMSIRDAESPPCDAPGHFNIYGIQKITEEQSKRTIVKISYFQPNGGYDMGVSPKERVYYAVSGPLTVNGKDGEKHDLRPGTVFISSSVKNAIW